MNAATNTNTTASSIKPMAVWAALAQCSPKAFGPLFCENAESLASAYTGPKQLANALQRVNEQYGLKPVFRAMLKNAVNGLAVADCFAVAMEGMLKPAKPAKAKPSKLEGLLKALPAFSLEERKALLLALQALEGQPSKAVEAALM